MNINDYTLFSDAQIGTTISRPVLVTKISEASDRNGNPYVRITMKDGKTEQSANKFSMTAEMLKTEQRVDEGSIAFVELAVQSYNGSKSFLINSIIPNTDTDITAADFVRLPPVDIDQMYLEICEMVRNSADDCGGKYAPLSDLALDILEKNKEEYISSSAAIAMHHNLRGGLIYHSYRMVKAADAICNIYGILDRELMICGSALHDIGKIWEYNTTVTGDASFTPDGVMFGHLYLGARKIEMASYNFKCNPEKVQLLEHMILSHHGTQEWGAVACPATAEAMALHLIDNLDAKMYSYEEQYSFIEKGGITEKKPFGFDNRFYRPTF